MLNAKNGVLMVDSLHKFFQFFQIDEVYKQSKH